MIGNSITVSRNVRNILSWMPFWVLLVGLIAVFPARGVAAQDEQPFDPPTLQRTPNYNAANQTVTFNWTPASNTPAGATYETQWLYQNNNATWSGPTETATTNRTITVEGKSGETLCLIVRTKTPARASGWAPAACKTIPQQQQALAPPTLQRTPNYNAANQTVTFNWTPASNTPAGATYETQWLYQNNNATWSGPTETDTTTQTLNTTNQQNKTLCLRARTKTPTQTSNWTPAACKTIPNPRPPVIEPTNDVSTSTTTTATIPRSSSSDSSTITTGSVATNADLTTSSTSAVDPPSRSTSSGGQRQASTTSASPASNESTTTTTTEQLTTSSEPNDFDSIQPSDQREGTSDSGGLALVSLNDLTDSSPMEDEDPEGNFPIAKVALFTIGLAATGGLVMLITATSRRIIP